MVFWVSAINSKEQIILTFYKLLQKRRKKKKRKAAQLATSRASLDKITRKKLLVI